MGSPEGLGPHVRCSWGGLFAALLLAPLLCSAAVDAQILGNAQKFERQISNLAKEADGAGTRGAGVRPSTGAAAEAAETLDPPGNIELPPDDVVQTMMAWAEKGYRKNVAKRDGFAPLTQLHRRPPKYGKVDYYNAMLYDFMFLPLYPCTMETRLGVWGDGGKWVCLAHTQRNKNPKVVVSVGSRGDTSFEAAVFRGLGARSHTLDFSLTPPVAKQVSSLPFVTLHQVGLKGSSEKPTGNLAKYNWVNFQEMLALTGKNYIDILKMDCELCEYAVVQDLKANYTRLNVPVGQILVELHLAARVQESFPFLDALEGLGFRLFHSEINRWKPTGFLDYHYELAFIHESLVVTT